MHLFTVCMKLNIWRFSGAGKRLNSNTAEQHIYILQDFTQRPVQGNKHSCDRRLLKQNRLLYCWQKYYHNDPSCHIRRSRAEDLVAVKHDFPVFIFAAISSPFKVKNQANINVQRWDEGIQGTLNTDAF